MNLRHSIQSTIKYASYFNFCLTPAEVHYWLNSSQKVSSKKIAPYLPANLTSSNKKRRDFLTTASRKKIAYAKELIKKLNFIPGLKMVAITGSVAAFNSHPSDDIDLFFITSPNSLWLVRPLVLFVISLFFRRRLPGEDHSKAKNAFCPNLWLDAHSLSVPLGKQGLYTAHEVLQVLPLLDKDNTYQNFLYQNLWAKKYLANAYFSLASKSYSPASDSRLTSLLIPFNYLFYFIQRLYMFPKKTTETVHLHAAYLHTTDFASKIQRYLADS